MSEEGCPSRPPRVCPGRPRSGRLSTGRVKRLYREGGKYHTTKASAAVMMGGAAIPVGRCSGHGLRGFREEDKSDLAGGRAAVLPFNKLYHPVVVIIITVAACSRPQPTAHLSKAGDGRSWACAALRTDDQTISDRNPIPPLITRTHSSSPYINHNININVSNDDDNNAAAARRMRVSVSLCLTPATTS